MNGIIVAGIALVVCIAGFMIYKFLGSPSEKQMEMIMTWLLMAVTEAEKEFGSGTGKLKLSKVYGWFIDKFPWLCKRVSVDEFNKLVEDVLVQMKHLIESNKRIADYVSD